MASLGEQTVTIKAKGVKKVTKRLKQLSRVLKKLTKQAKNLDVSLSSDERREQAPEMLSGTCVWINGIPIVPFTSEMPGEYHNAV